MKTTDDEFWDVMTNACKEAHRQADPIIDQIAIIKKRGEMVRDTPSISYSDMAMRIEEEGVLLRLLHKQMALVLGIPNEPHSEETMAGGGSSIITLSEEVLPVPKGFFITLKTKSSLTDGTSVVIPAGYCSTGKPTEYSIFHGTASPPADTPTAIVKTIPKGTKLIVF